MSSMASTNRSLLGWFTSRNPLQVFMKIVPLIVLLVYLMIRFKQVAVGWYLLCFFLGMLTWSFMEYSIHRWVYHQRYSNKRIKWFIDSFHIHHHKHLDDYEVLNAGFLLVYPIFCIIGAAVFLFTQQLDVSAAFCLGVVSYYFFYENIHYFIHYKEYRSGYMRFIQHYHLYHHYMKWNKNYGNTTAFWDRLLGTYDAGYKQMHLSAEQRSFFITNHNA